MSTTDICAVLVQTRIVVQVHGVLVYKTMGVSTSPRRVKERITPKI